MINVIREHKKTTIIIAIFIILCIILSVSYVRDKNSSLESNIQKGSAVASAPISGFVNNIKYGIDSLFSFLSTAKENEELKLQIEDLQKALISEKLSASELDELRNLYQVLNYESVQTQYDQVAANIVSYDNSDFFNVFVIDRGAESGIQEENIVMCGDGLVGRVIESGNGFSKIMTVIDEGNKISFQVLNDMEIMGMLEGAGGDKMVGYTFDGNASIQKGDEVITTNIGIYPAGIPIGRITNVEYDNDSQKKTVEVTVSANLKSIKRVVVLVDAV